MMGFRWIIYLFLVAVGFYFGKYVGAIGLPLLFFYLFHAKQFKITPSSEIIRENDWAYQVLQLSPSADVETARKARKKMINQYHPDKLPSSASERERLQASEKVNEINRAFDAIMKNKHEK